MIRLDATQNYINVLVLHGIVGATSKLIPRHSTPLEDAADNLTSPVRTRAPYSVELRDKVAAQTRKAQKVDRSVLEEGLFRIEAIPPLVVHEFLDIESELDAKIPFVVVRSTESTEEDGRWCVPLYIP